MRKVVEFSLFMVLAILVHLAFWRVLDEGAVQSSGDGGQDLLSLQPATASIARMVRQWDTPPEAVADFAELVSPDISAPELLPLQTTPQQSVPANTVTNVPQMPVAAQGTVPLPPQAVNPPEALPPEVVAKAPTPETPRPVRRPPPKPPAQTTGRKTTVTRSQASSAATAAGTGGQEARGTRNQANTATLSDGQRASLLKRWGSKIRARIARRAPRGVGKGTAVVVITLNGSGQLLGVRLKQSSGNPKLDQLAVAAVHKAGSFPAAPKGLNISSHSFALPVRSR